MLVDGYVTDESGTGVVHSAPAFGEVSVTCSHSKIDVFLLYVFFIYVALIKLFVFGSVTLLVVLNIFLNSIFVQDDYRVCLANGILQKGGKIPCPVDPSGKFTDDVSDFKGQHVKVCKPGQYAHGAHTGNLFFGQNVL